MLSKQEYLALKKYIKNICIESVEELCINTGLTEYETNLVRCINKDETRTAIGIKFGISESKIRKDFRKCFNKINDYMKRNNLPYM